MRSGNEKTAGKHKETNDIQEIRLAIVEGDPSRMLLIHVHTNLSVAATRLGEISLEKKYKQFSAITFKRIAIPQSLCNLQRS
jgi:hypothetical protein